MAMLNMIIICLTKSELDTFVETSLSLCRITTEFQKWRHPQQEQTNVAP